MGYFFSAFKKNFIAVFTICGLYFFAQCSERMMKMQRFSLDCRPNFCVKLFEKSEAPIQRGGAL